MPFLRFSRDKRGYANTFLCHTFREDGVVRMRVLYWFRTPPDIEVGRIALDDEAIRDIEASNPDLIFDWDEIMKAKPLPPSRDHAGGEAPEPRSRRRGRGAPSGGRGAPAVAGGPPAARAAGASRDASHAAATGAEPGAGEAGSRPDASPGRRRRPTRRRSSRIPIRRERIPPPGLALRGPDHAQARGPVASPCSAIMPEWE